MPRLDVSFFDLLHAFLGKAQVLPRRFLSLFDKGVKNDNFPSFDRAEERTPDTFLTLGAYLEESFSQWCGIWLAHCLISNALEQRPDVRLGQGPGRLGDDDREGDRGQAGDS